MVYSFMTLNDGTGIAHSESYTVDGIEKVKVFIEQPVESGFNSAECILPDYEWSDIEGFSDEQMKYLTEFIESTAHIIIHLARTGGFDNAAGL